MPILRTVLEWNPDLFVYLGDNIYGDTSDMQLLEAKYAKLAANRDFQALRAAMPTIATWDDHDYGENDAGKEFPLKAESKDIFLKFWNEPISSPRREHDRDLHELPLRGREHSAGHCKSSCWILGPFATSL